MLRRTVTVLRLFMLLLAASAALATTAGAADRPRVLFVIDASGSMWGRIDGREKIVTVRDLVASRIGELKDGFDVGVMSYGHRRRRDCRDAELLLPIGPVDEEEYSRTIRRLVPRGKTPISYALKQAAAALGPAGKDNPAEIILIADGSENCHQDPCATAAEIAAAQPGLRIDVIGFGIQEADIGGLACIARATHGQFDKAEDTAALTSDLARILARLKALPGSSKPAAPVTPPGLYLSAALSAKAQPLQDPIGWRIYRSGESAQTGAAPLQREQAAAPVVELAAGRYHVEARYGPLVTAGDVAVAADKAVPLRLDFNAGIVTAEARLATGGPVDKDVSLSLYDLAAGPPSPATVIALKQESKPVFFLKPGRYSLRGRIGEATKRQDFSLEAGQREAIDIVLDAGSLSLTSSLAASGPTLDNVAYTLYRRDPAQPDRYTEFLRTLDPRPQLVLPAGDYLVVAEKDAATASRTVAVAAGGAQTIAIPLGAARLTLTPQVDGRPTMPGRDGLAVSIDALGPPDSTVIALADGRQQKLARPLPVRSTRNRFVLPAGRYRLDAVFGNGNAGNSTEITLAPGEDATASIDLTVGFLRPSLSVSAGDPPLPGVFWSVVTPNGSQVASASRATPRLTLKPGRYRLVADYLGKRYERPVSIDAGSTTSLRLTLD